MFRPRKIFVMIANNKFLVEKYSEIDFLSLRVFLKNFNYKYINRILLFFPYYYF